MSSLMSRGCFGLVKPSGLQEYRKITLVHFGRVVFRLDLEVNLRSAGQTKSTLDWGWGSVVQLKPWRQAIMRDLCFHTHTQMHTHRNPQIQFWLTFIRPPRKCFWIIRKLLATWVSFMCSSSSTTLFLLLRFSVFCSLPQSVADTLPHLIFRLFLSCLLWYGVSLHGERWCLR